MISYYAIHVFCFRANFQMINIFYRDMSYTEYNQVQDASVTQLLSKSSPQFMIF